MPTATVKLLIDGAQIEKLLRGPQGALGKWMIGRGEVVRRAAIEDCPKRTTRLATSIRTRWVDAPEGFSVFVIAGANDDDEDPSINYALPVHEGSRPHDIPNAFGWGPDFGIGGRFDGQFHPGNRPSRFLTKNIPLFGAV